MRQTQAEVPNSRACVTRADLITSLRAMLAIAESNHPKCDLVDDEECCAVFAEPREHAAIAMAQLLVFLTEEE